MKKSDRKHDAYGAFLLACNKDRRILEIIERDDGYIEASDYFSKIYFYPFAKWDIREQRAMRYAKGPALDIGAGAGRTTLYLQKKGIETLAIDNSQGAVQVMKKRGVKNVRLLAIERLAKLPEHHFRTIVMMGNNFGLFGSKRRMPAILKVMGRITTSHARIIAECRNPYSTTNPLHLAYHRQNRKKGRMSGHLRLRVRYNNIIGPWFDYLFASPQEIRKQVKGTGWQVERILKGKGPQFVVMMRKQN